MGRTDTVFEVLSPGGAEMKRRDFRAPWWAIAWCRLKLILRGILEGVCFGGVFVLVPIIAAFLA